MFAIILTMKLALLGCALVVLATVPARSAPPLFLINALALPSTNSVTGLPDASWRSVEAAASSAIPSGSEDFSLRDTWTPGNSSWSTGDGQGSSTSSWWWAWPSGDLGTFFYIVLGIAVFSVIVGSILHFLK